MAHLQLLAHYSRRPQRDNLNIMPHKLLGVSNSSCDKYKSFHKVGTGLVSPDIRCHLVFQSLICNASKIKGG